MVSHSGILEINDHFIGVIWYIKLFRKVPTVDVVVMVLVTALTIIFHNLALAVIAGVIVSALAFAWENAKRIRANKYVDEQGVKAHFLDLPREQGHVTA